MSFLAAVKRLFLCRNPRIMAKKLIEEDLRLNILINGDAGKKAALDAAKTYDELGKKLEKAKKELSTIDADLRPQGYENAQKKIQALSASYEKARHLLRLDLQVVIQSIEQRYSSTEGDPFQERIPPERKPGVDVADDGPGQHQVLLPGGVPVHLYPSALQLTGYGGFDVEIHEPGLSLGEFRRQIIPAQYWLAKIHFFFFAQLHDGVIQKKNLLSRFCPV